ncbi:MAG: transglutaminase family protein, partial [Bacteroidota bacterium]
MKFKIEHTTQYEYAQAINLSYNMAWVSPRHFPGQQVLSHSLKILPEPSQLHQHTDFFGNTFTYFAIHNPHTLLTITAESQILREVQATQVPLDYLAWDRFATQLEAQNFSWQELKIYTLPSLYIPVGDYLMEYAHPSFPPGKPLFLAVKEFMERIFTEFEYNPEFSTIATPVHEVLAAKKGVCQDFAHLAIGCLRSMGLPARYVSGYIESQAPEEEENLIGAAASHAWFSVFIPNLGWIDFDPTNNQIPRNQHISVAWGRDYADVPPVKGVVYGSGNQQLEVG